jgi:hypothetical protein
VFMRTETELILKSRRVVPARLLEEGFRFTYPDWRSAARDLCQQAKTFSRTMQPQSVRTMRFSRGGDIGERALK